MTKTLLAATAVAAITPANGAELLHVTRTGTFHVDAPPEHAFALFTAPGERLWAPGWDPVVVSGGIGLERDSVWLTGEGEEHTVWLVVDYDPAEFHARSARITPTSRAGTVEVRLRPDGNAGSTVEVTYVLTALSELGNEVLAEFDEDAYADMMVEWENLIRDASITYPVAFGSDR
jgi:hypothetical protein